MTLIIIIAVVLALILYFIIEYNGLIKMSNMVREAFSTMDVYLKKRWDLVPNLVETVKGYAAHEKEVLEKVAELRSASYDKLSNEEKITTNEQLGEGIASLFAVAENYPELRASKGFSDLQAQLARIEDEIAQSRKYYNAVVKNMNNKVEMFPSNLVAKMFNFDREKMFEAGADERESVKVDM